MPDAASSRWSRAEFAQECSGPADPAALAEVEQQLDARAGERLEEGCGREAVDADGHHPGHQ
jgi:hypothetical protein